MAHIIITGATGLAGSVILQQALASPSIAKISILSRRPVPRADGHPKANVIIHKDFTSYPPELLSQLSDATACIWAQGISSIGMKEDEYTTITVTYPLAAAKAFTTLPGSPNKPFNFVHVSGRGADQEGKSRAMFGRVKGVAEKTLVEIAASRKGRFTAYNLRPGGIDAGKEWLAERKPNWMERSFMAMAPVLRPLGGDWLTPVGQLAQASIKLALGGGGKMTGEGVHADGYTLETPALRTIAGQ
ncbi:hypothetical protein DRE_02949 [Drechslerella stenobrocha 248]|uniref:NAD(P)-binding domain-containing protein n=1 Tax=Drechslerella stenobrocha 248 TaxID=1043628 RepID=W7HW45_9PEZI|nr:hypothetical protein DRE_02949 [Drechslerella stenobrocha 248]